MTNTTDDLILIAYDGSENADRAIRHAARFLSSRRAVVLTVWEPLIRQASRVSALSGMMQPDWVADGQNVTHDEAKGVCETGVKLAREAGLTAEGRCVETGTTVWGTIVATADEVDAAVIVSGTRGMTGIRALLQSHTAHHVLQHSHRPMLVVPPASKSGKKSPEAKSAAQGAAQQAEEAGPTDEAGPEAAHANGGGTPAAT